MMTLFLEIYMGFYLLYVQSEKARKKVASSKISVILRYRKIAICLAYCLFFHVIWKLTEQYGCSVGIVSWWVFITPILLILIGLQTCLTKN